ncbi:MAG: hypothetical protein IKH76_01515 [Clostridiales bacterium]|nr:hypothetical protein [Clostridiales bacterium]
MHLRLNGIFKDNMIFQWGAELRVFGVADEACSIFIRMIKDGEIIDESGGTTEDDLSFVVCLKAVPEPGGPYTVQVYSLTDTEDECNEEKTMNGCYAGEVWLAAGQDNMKYPLVRSEFAQYTLEELPETDIHFYHVPQAGFMDEEQEREEEASEWVIVDKDSCREMSAVAFYFGRELEASIDCKIGIIGCYMSKTSVCYWLSEEKLMSTQDGKRMKERYDREAADITEQDFDELQEEYEIDKRQYDSCIRSMLKNDPYLTYEQVKEQIGPFLINPPKGARSVRRPGSLFDCMVSRVAPFVIRGVIYYQGETDCEENAVLYGTVFKSLIEEWREVFVNPDMPFIFCQLPMYISKERRFMNYDDLAWAKLREQQERVANDVHDTYMAVLADCGEFDNIHPADKRTPGVRLAAIALKYVYGFSDVPARAPYVIDARRGDGVEISFGGDFRLLNMATGYDPNDTGFEVAGEDGEFYKASATVDFDGKTIILNCPKVEYPVKVRYGYFSYGATPLYADNGLAATPFCTDVEKTLGGT